MTRIGSILASAAAAAATILVGVSSASAQATEVLTAPGDGELTLSFTPSPEGVAHDVYLAAEAGVTASNFITLDGGRAIFDVASPITIRGLDNNRDYFIAVVERDAAGAASAAGEVVGTPRGLWAHANNEAAFVSVAVDAETPGIALAAGNAAGGCQVTPKPAGCDVYRSTDGGASWAVVTTEITDMDPVAVAINNGIGLAATRNILAAGDRILRSGDGGATFGLSITGTIAAGNDKAFAFDPSDPNTVFAGNFDFGRGALSRIVRSVDGGQNWSHLAELVAPNALNSRTIAVDPASPMVIWLGGAGTPRLARSTDGGNNWTEVVITVIGAVQDIVFDPLAPTKIWLADSTQVYGSQNGGAVFTPRMSGFAAGTQIRALARDGDDEILYVGTNTGVYESRDDGRTFVAIGTGLDATVTDLAFSADPKGLIAATPAGVYHLDMIPAGPIAPPADAGPDAGDGGGDDGGCGCQSGSSPRGAPIVLLLIAALVAVRGSRRRDGRSSPRRSRE